MREKILSEIPKERLSRRFETQVTSNARKADISTLDVDDDAQAW